MAKLHGLIKLRKHELDEKRQELAKVNAKIAKLEQRKSNLTQQMTEEKKLAETQNDHIAMIAPVGPYISKVLEEQRQISLAIERIIKESEEIINDVRLAFLEVKKLEITQERRDTEAQERLDKIEQAILDEIALVRHRTNTLNSPLGQLS